MSSDPSTKRDVQLSEEEQLVKSILDSKGSDRVVQTTLRTDERVIARVTDGIYRQPASALRELISNAYDADATQVVVKTDRPRFERIYIEDDGHGMSAEAVAHLLLHIGGSAKRSDKGAELGVTSATDPARSPGGRRLIGKIGIGLFSVSQLTRSFQIITKVAGDKFRTVATVILRQYSDDPAANPPDEHTFESGKVNIWREKAADVTAHGTTIVLTSIRPQARDTLRSREIWSAIEQNESTSPGSDARKREPPKYHIGRVDLTGALLTKSDGEFSALPWDASSTPKQAFKKLVDSVWAEVYAGVPNPKLERLFDYYLRMIWQLSLAVPLPYVDGHLFDMDLSDWAVAFRLSNEPKGLAERIELQKHQRIREIIGLTDPLDAANEFHVFIDDLQLSRPIKFRNLPTTSHALKTPLVFLGKCRQEFAKVPIEMSGGPLEFEAYLFWNPKIAPTEHQGALIRIHGSSGTLFDPTFLRYQVSEQTRSRQITCEIFVTQGLEGALNIDRESFNNAHPHAIFVTNWLHSAFRQLATAQKREAAELRVQARHTSKSEAVTEIRRVAESLWRLKSDDPASRPPQVVLAGHGSDLPEDADTYVYNRIAIVPEQQRRQTVPQKARAVILDEKLKAMVQVLASFGLLEYLTTPQQEELLRTMYEILDSPDE